MALNLAILGVMYSRAVSFVSRTDHFFCVTSKSFYSDLNKGDSKHQHTNFQPQHIHIRSVETFQF